MPTQKSPESTVIILKSVNPVEVNGDYLTYPALHDELEAQQATIADRWETFEAAEPGSNEERTAASNLAAYYLLQTAVKLNEDGQNKDLWADRFTQANEELYGIEPDSKIWTSLHHEEVQELQAAAQSGNSYASTLLDLYETLELHLDPESEKTSELLPNQAWRNFLLQKYERVFDLVDDNREYGPHELESLFEESFEVMAEVEGDNRWLEWHTEIVDKDMVSVVGTEQVIRIGKHRVAEESIKTRQLQAHELLVHALRAQRAKVRDRQDLVKGFSGYIDAEEGLGIVNETVIDGQMPHKATDRYHDIGLALGLGGKQLTRQQLLEIARLRNLAREPEMDPVKARDRAKAHINRIFRGGPAFNNEHVRQAVFVKDMSYFVGYNKMCEFINQELNAGKPVEELFNWLMQGKFDPTNSEHTKPLNDK